MLYFIRLEIQPRLEVSVIYSDVRSTVSYLQLDRGAASTNASTPITV